MSTEVATKRENYTGWIVAVVGLLLVAIGIHITAWMLRPLEIRIDLANKTGTTNSVVWTCELDGQHLSGTTNLPVTMVFKAHKVDFVAKPVSPSTPLVMHFQWEYYIHAHATVTSAPVAGHEGVRISGTGRTWTAYDSVF